MSNKKNMICYDELVARLDKILTEEDFKLLKLKIFSEKKSYIELKLKDVFKDASTEFIQEVAFNKEGYLSEVCCQWDKLYTMLNPEQKLTVLVNVYCVYYFNPDETRTYLTPKEFIQTLDEGRIEEYKVSCVGNVLDYMRDLPELIPSDALFWLQHEWNTLSGDWFEKIRNRDYVSRNTRRFTARTYQAFNEIFKQCFNRELKCIDKYRDKTLLKELNEVVNK